MLDYVDKLVAGGLEECWWDAVWLWSLLDVQLLDLEQYVVLADFGKVG